MNQLSASSKFTCKHGTTDMLIGRNYHSWKNDILMYLSGEGAINIVLELEKAPNKDANIQSRIDYQKRHGRAATMIYSSVDPSCRSVLNSLQLKDRSNPARMWEALADRYNTAASQSSRIAILQSFSNARLQPGNSVSSFINSMSDM